MASPAAIVDGLSAAFPTLDEFGRQVRGPDATVDTELETDRQADMWNKHVLLQYPNGESVAKVGVREQLLQQWLGERFVSRCIRVAAQDLAMTQVQQIVDSLLPDVPVERKEQVNDPEPRSIYRIQVVDRDAFALELAREWVRTGLPRAPVL